MGIKRYDVRAVEMDGTIIAFLPNINLHRITTQLNKPGSIEFSISLYDPASAYVEKYVEIQVWRDGAIYWWGVVVLVQIPAGSGRKTIQCQGLLWYLFRRYIGRADRTNLLLNPSFEAFGANWDDFGSTTFTVDDDFYKEGEQSAKLVNTVSSDSGIRQDISVTAGTVGEVLTLVAWSRMLSSGLAAGGVAGIRLESLVPITLVREEIAETTQAFDGPKDSWVRHEVEIQILPSITRVIRASALDVDGTIRWDSFSLTKMESLSFYNTDQAAIFAALIGHLQDTAYDKSDVNIATTTPDTGIKMDKHWQFAEHQKGDSAIDEFWQRSDGFDIEMVINATERYLTIRYPRMGTEKSAFRINNRNIIDYTFADNGEDGITSKTILGEGDGPDREEGAAIDDTAFGGLILEDVESAPTGTDIALLNRIAEEKLRVEKDPRNIHVTVNNEVLPVIENVHVGDTLPVNIFDGTFAIVENMRVISKTIAPHKEHCTLELNPA